jgi:hypothetical protein
MAEHLAGLNKSDGFSYSTSEKWTGKYDTDGRKIYVKVVTGTTPSSSFASIAHGITGLYKNRNLYGYCKTLSGSFIPLGFWNGAQYFCAFTNSTNLELRIQQEYYALPFEITIEYTKS